MNIHQSSAIRGCFNTVLQYEQDIYYHFNNLVDLTNHWRVYLSNNRNDRDQTIKTKAANALYTTISRHVKLIEKYHYNISYIKDKRFPPVINKFNALIVCMKPSPR